VRGDSNKDSKQNAGMKIKSSACRHLSSGSIPHSDLWWIS